MVGDPFDFAGHHSDADWGVVLNDDEYKALLRVVRAAEIIHRRAEYDLKHERPGYYTHSDLFHDLTLALEALPEHLRED